MKRLLLFVDDNVTLLNLLTRSFKEHFDVIGFSDSMEAFKYIAEHPENLDIILSDYKMPHYNGIQVLEKAMNVKSSTIRILFTGYSDIDDVKNNCSVYDTIIDKSLLKNTGEIIKVIKDVSSKNKSENK